MLLRFAAMIFLAGATFGVALADTPSAPGAREYFIGLKNGDTVPTTFVVHFGISGMGVAPAGVEFANSGHHHLVVDAPTPPLNTFLPTDDPQHVMHFGKGQTETQLTLTAGKHTLQLIFADQDHKPHTPPLVSEKITVTVK